MKALLYFVCAVMFISCTNDDDGTGSALPSHSTHGSNTFACLVNGVVFVPKDKAPWLPPQGPVLAARYTYIPEGTQDETPGYSFSIYAVNELLSTRVSIGIDGFNEPLTEGQTYPISLRQNGIFSGQYDYSTSTPHPDWEGAYIYEEHKFITTTEHTGVLTITHIDEANHIIAGTFSFDGINTTDNSVTEVREGRFDVVYDPNY